MRATEGLSACGRAAMMYAQHGWAVFPCWAGRKVPATQHGVLDATTARERIETWWREKPALNVAIQCGAASGVWVLDLDTTKHPDTMARLQGLCDAGGFELDELREAAEVVRTASGGEHWYFQHEDGIGSGKVLQGIAGIDWRGDGGYVVAPPSTVDDRPYSWVDFAGELPTLRQAPRWMVQLVSSGGLVVRRDKSIEQLWTDQVYDGEGRLDAVWRMSGHLLARLGDPATAWTMIQSWNETHCVPPVEARRLRSLFDGIARRDAQRHPERAEEAEQIRQLEEILGPVGPAPASLVDAPVARAVQQAQHEERETRADEAELDEESSTSEARDAASTAGLLALDGTQDPGFALRDKEQHTAALDALKSMLKIRVARVIRYAGDPERYVLRLEGGIDIDLGSSATAAQATAVSVRLWDSRGVQLTKYARTKGWPTVRALLYALREDLDAELGLRDEAAELIRACYGRGRADIFDRGEPHEPASWSAWMESGKGWLEDGTLFLPWTHLRRAAETINRMATDVWIRRRLQAIEGEGRRIQLRDPVTGQVVRVRAYAIPSSGDLA